MRAASTSARPRRYSPAPSTSWNSAGAGRPIVDGLAEVEPVADAAAVVDGEHHVSLAGQILVHGVSLVVVIHVVPAQQHLPPRSPVHEDHGRVLLAGRTGGR